MHNCIKKYTYEGFIRDDSDFIRLRLELERLMEQEMRDAGYVPIYELSNHWTTIRDSVGKRYQFKLSMYGSYAGKVKAQSFKYWSNGKLI